MTLMELSDVMQQVLGALSVSLVITCVGAYISLKIQGESLKRTTHAVEELTKAVSDLKTSLGIFSEKYITREEFERKIEKLEERLKNGS